MLHAVAGNESARSGEDLAVGELARGHRDVDGDRGEEPARTRVAARAQLQQEQDRETGAAAHDDIR
jgi:hypothetical protein